LLLAGDYVEYQPMKVASEKITLDRFRWVVKRILHDAIIAQSPFD